MGEVKKTVESTLLIVFLKLKFSNAEAVFGTIVLRPRRMGLLMC